MTISTNAAGVACCGYFVPFNPARTGRRSAKVGWVTNASGCDIWQGCTNSDGYAQVSVDGRMLYVHRVRYEREVGPIPDGMDLDHYVCDNGAGACCTPLHCRPATRRENGLRGTSFAAVNAAKTHCPKGHPLSGDNLAKTQLARGDRNCRICRNARERARRRAAKVAQ